MTSGSKETGLLERAAELKAAGAEPMIFPADCEYLAWSEADIKSFAAYGRKLGVSIPAVAMGVFTADDALINPSEKDKAVDLITRSLKFAQSIEASVLMLCNFFAAHPDTPEKIAQTVTVLREAAVSAGELGVKIALESPLSASELLAMLEAVDSDNVGVYYDVGNAVALGFDPVKEIKQLHGHILGMHIKDTRLKLGDSHLGQGRVDLAGCREAMREIGYNEWLILETLPNDENAVKQDIEMLKEML